MENLKVFCFSGLLCMVASLLAIAFCYFFFGDFVRFMIGG